MTGDRVATARREAGLTQKELADRLGVSLWNVERLESAKGFPVARHDALARVTGKPEGWFTEAGQPHGPSNGDRAGDAEGNSPGLVLILASLTMLVVIRFFTEVVPVVPRVANFIDIPIFLVLVVAALLQPRLRRDEQRDVWVFLAPGLFLILVCAFATLANPSRVEAAPVLVFMYGYLAPLGVFYATYRLWPVGSSLALSRLLVGLGLVQLLVVVAIDLPRSIATSDPDQISGTFGTNAYQLVYFLLVFGALLAGIFTFENQRRIARAVPLLFVALLATIFLAQYRALLLTTLLTLVLIAALLGTVRLRGLVLGAMIAAIFVATFAYTAQTLPFLRLEPVAAAFTDDPTAYLSSRARALAHVGDLYSDEPRYIATGTGPGTYASRAWQTFGLSASTSETNVAGPYALLLTGGDAYRTDVSDKYISPSLRHGKAIQGSYALTSPWSDYTSLLAEVGIFGFAAVVVMYALALGHAGRLTMALRRGRRRQDPLPALALAAAVGFFVLLQMAALQSWLEVTRVTFPTWILLAVVTKEFRARVARGELTD